VTVGDFTLRFFGGTHAVIHSSIPTIENVGVLVNEELYYPGDSYAVPEGIEVDTLAAPLGAPWLKIGEAMDYVLAVKDCFTAFRTGTLDHHGEFYDLDFITPQWSPGPLEAPDPKVDVAAVNPWMLRMAGEVADGVHVHPLGEPGYLTRHVVPGVAEGARRAGRSASDVAVIVPVMTIVGDDEEDRRAEREQVRASMSFYGSTPNYAFIWDEAGFEGTTARIREKQKAGDFAGMASEITDDHLSVFATESSWNGLAGDLVAKYGGTVDRLVFYNAAGDTPERFERYGVVAQAVSSAA
jgi:probable F420-dependent oxidoreductase